MRKKMKAMTRKKNKRLRKLTPKKFVGQFYKRNRALMTELAYD